MLKLAGFATWVNRIRFDAQGHRLLGAAAADRAIHAWDATPLSDQPQ